MTIGIPGGHFFLSPLHPSPLHPSPFQSRLLSVIPGFSLSFLTSLIVIPDFPLRHSRLDRESLSKKFKTFQKKKNFLSEKEKYLIGYCLRPISS